MSLVSQSLEKISAARTRWPDDRLNLLWIVGRNGNAKIYNECVALNAPPDLSDSKYSSFEDCLSFCGLPVVVDYFADPEEFRLASVPREIHDLFKRRMKIDSVAA